MAQAVLDTSPARDGAETGYALSTLRTVIVPRRGLCLPNFAELWSYRELLYFLVWRDIKVRYKQTVLGASWALLQPLAMVGVFSVLLTRAGGDFGSIPKPLFLFAGLLPWLFFGTSVAQAANSLVGSQSLITKIYFPRLFVPLSALGSPLLDFTVASGMLGLFIVHYRVLPGGGWLMAPLIFSLLMLSAAGVGLLLSALTVAYRDFRHVVPFMVQLWMFSTPAIYVSSTAFAGSRLEYLLPLNPAHGLIENFRLALVNQPLDLYSLAVSSAVALLCVFVGLFYFQYVERSFADVI